MWDGTIPLGYQYEHPINYDECAQETIDDFQFEMYCFDDFEEMLRCAYADYSETQETKPVSGCDYQSKLTVQLISLEQQPKAQITMEGIAETFPTETDINYTYYSGKGNNIPVGEFYSTDGRLSLFSIKQFDSKYVAVFHGVADELNQNRKLKRAFTTFATSFRPYNNSDASIDAVRDAVATNAAEIATQAASDGITTPTPP